MKINLKTKPPLQTLSAAGSAQQLVQPHSISSSNQPSNPISERDDKMQLCTICEQSRPRRLFQIFSKNCGHLFCWICIEQFIKFSIKNGRVVYCLQEGCKQTMDCPSPLLQSLPVATQVSYYNLLVNLNLIADPLIKACPTVDCAGFLSVQKDQKQCQQWVQCYECNRTFCYHCSIEKLWHLNKREQMVQRLKQDYTYQRCPNCRQVVEKIQGCHHIVCLCGYEFCYLCGRGLQSHNNRFPCNSVGLQDQFNHPPRRSQRNVLRRSASSRWSVSSSNYSSSKWTSDEESSSSSMKAIEKFIQRIKRLPSVPSSRLKAPKIKLPQKKKASKSLLSAEPIQKKRKNPKKTSNKTASMKSEQANVTCCLVILKVILILPVVLIMLPLEILFHGLAAPFAACYYKCKCKKIRKFFCKNQRCCKNGWVSPSIMRWSVAT